VRPPIQEERYGMVWRENIDSGYPNFQLDTRSSGYRRSLDYLLRRLRVDGEGSARKSGPCGGVRAGKTGYPGRIVRR
jgi:hypothetical protein